MVYNAASETNTTKNKTKVNRANKQIFMQIKSAQQQQKFLLNQASHFTGKLINSIYINNSHSVILKTTFRIAGSNCENQISQKAGTEYRLLEEMKNTTLLFWTYALEKLTRQHLDLKK